MLLTEMCPNDSFVSSFLIFMPWISSPFAILAGTYKTTLWATWDSDILVLFMKLEEGNFPTENDVSSENMIGIIYQVREILFFPSLLRVVL